MIMKISQSNLSSCSSILANDAAGTLEKRFFKEQKQKIDYNPVANTSFLKKVEFEKLSD